MDSDIDWPMGPWSIDPDPHGPVKIRSPGRWPDTARSAAQASGADDSSVAAFPPAFTRSEDARQAFMTPDTRFRFGFTPGCMAAIESRSSSGRLGRAARGVRPTAGATNRYVTSGYPDQSTMGLSGYAGFGQTPQKNPPKRVFICCRRRPCWPRLFRPGRGPRRACLAEVGG